MGISEKGFPQSSGIPSLLCRGRLFSNQMYVFLLVCSPALLHLGGTSRTGSIGLRLFNVTATKAAATDFALKGERNLGLVVPPIYVNGIIVNDAA